MIKKLIFTMNDMHENMKDYFIDGQNEIPSSNLKTLRVLSIITSIAIILFSLITRLVLKGWKPSIYHYFFMVVMLFFVLLSLYLNRHIPKNKWVQRLVCLVFTGIYMVFIGIMDTVPYPYTSQIFMGVFLVIAPIIFIIPFSHMIIGQLIFTVLFSLMTFHFKILTLARTDCLGIILSLVVSIIIYAIVMNLRIEEYLEKKSYKISSEKDALTGIDNRAACNTRIQQILEHKKEQEACAMMVLDIDNFKEINDTLGHNKGDEVLVAFANDLSEIFRKSDVVGRFGGDEFIVFLNDVNDINTIKQKCAEIETQMKFILGGRFNISCSIGVCVLDEGQATLEKMFKVADDALYGTKSFNKGKYTIHKYQNNERLSQELPLMLIVDDNSVDREVVSLQFEENFRIEKIEDGTSGLKYIQENYDQISVVILDMIMPDLSGADILKILRENKDTKHIPVVAISSDEMTEEQALLYGADDMITKPIVPAVAKLRVQNAMRKK